MSFKLFPFVLCCALTSCTNDPLLVRIGAFVPVVDGLGAPSSSNATVVTEGMLDVTPGFPSFFLSANLVGPTLGGQDAAVLNSGTQQVTDPGSDFKLVITSLNLSYTISPKVVSGFRTASLPREFIFTPEVHETWTALDLITADARDTLAGVPVSTQEVDRTNLSVTIEYKGYSARSGAAISTGQDQFPLVVLNSQGGAGCLKPAQVTAPTTIIPYPGQSYSTLAPPQVCCDARPGAAGCL